LGEEATVIFGDESVDWFIGLFITLTAISAAISLINLGYILKEANRWKEKKELI
jgi:hypothetical protein